MPPALDPDTRNALGHFVESGVIPEDTEVIVWGVGQGLTVGALVGWF